jgi:hypothetical protein
MSGGHWGYMSMEIEEWGRKTSETMRLMAILERELDWGICGDSCHDCARIRTAIAIEAFFDTQMDNAVAAIALARDREQNLCPKCEKWRDEQKEKQAQP